MPASIFSETELARWASFPEEIPGDDLIRAFTLTGADRDLVAIRRGAANRLGLALQLCALRYLGFVPRNLSAAPRSAACFVADQLESTRRTPLATPRSSSPCFIFWGCSSPRASGTWALSAGIVSMLLRAERRGRGSAVGRKNCEALLPHIDPKQLDAVRSGFDWMPAMKVEFTRELARQHRFYKLLL